MTAGRCATCDDALDERRAALGTSSEGQRAAELLWGTCTSCRLARLPATLRDFVLEVTP